MISQRKIAACYASALADQRPSFKPGDWQPNDPRAGTVPHNFSLDSQIARARSEMGPDRWQQLQSEWNNKEQPQ